MLHELITTDYSGDFRESRTGYYPTLTEAAEEIARRGSFYGMLEYRLDGRKLSLPQGRLTADIVLPLIGGSPDETAAAYTARKLGELVDSFAPRVPTNPRSYREGAL